MKPGNLFEKQIVEYLQNMGFTNARRGGHQGVKDKGDVLGLPLPIVLELKRCSRMALGEWMREVEREMDHASACVGAVVHKRRGVADAGAQYVTLDLLSLVQLMKWAERGYDNQS